MSKADNKYERLSKERKELQAQGLIPEWFGTGGFQLFKERYEYETNGRSVKGQYERIAKTAAKYLKGTKWESEAFDKFMWLMEDQILSCSTPVFSNMGTDRGMPVSCSGGVVGDSVLGFYDSMREVAVLTKNGFGTSAYFGDIRPRGSSISVGGKASGTMPVLVDHFSTARNIAQGTARRGAFAGYVPITHGDFNEVADLLYNDPDDVNIGWCVYDDFIAALNNEDREATRRFQRSLKVKSVQGKGYFMFMDKINRKRPAMYIQHGLTVKASNLCTEITLFADEDHTFTCVLASMIVATWAKWKDSDAVYWATIFLDCVAQEFIEKAQGIPALEKAVRFTEKGRALGLGQCGYHTLLQENMLPYESFEAHMLSQEIAKHIHDESLRASQDMAKELGEPEWCKGFGVRNTHRTAIAPTKSTALLVGGISEGINPDPAMVYTADTSAGEIFRINPILLKIMKERGKDDKKTLKSIADNVGSVQHVDWLSDHEKEVFKTAFEINQKTHILRCAARGKYLCQWQSMNLSFGSEEDEGWIAECMQEAMENEDVLGVYYFYMQAGIQASKGECVACQ